MLKATPLRVTIILFAILLLLIVFQIAGLYFIYYGSGYDSQYVFIKLINFDAEQNLPTLYNTVLLLLNSVGFFFVWIVYTRNRSRWIWLFFSLVFLFLTVDEFCGIHEMLSEPFHEKFDTKGLLYFAWVIPYGIVAVLVLSFFIPLWLKMEQRERILFLLAAVLYFSGSVVIEMFEGRSYEQLGNQVDLKGDILVTFEESLEMGGLILLLYALMILIDKLNGGVKLHITSNKSGSW